MQSAGSQKGQVSQWYAGLDVFKLFFAVCVVAIHTYLTDALPEPAAFWIQQSVFRLAVPFFFVASGFLLGKKLHGKDETPWPVLRGFIGRLIPPLLCIGTANGLLELLLGRLRQGTIKRSMLVRFVKNMLFYPYGAMWYIYACIVGALLLYPFLKRRKLGHALLIGALLYVWALLCNNYYFAAQGLGIDRWVKRYMELFVSGRNGLFVGAFWLALGIGTYEWHRADGKTWPLKLGLAVCWILYLAEIYLLKEKPYLDDRALYIMQIPLVPLIVLNVLKLRLPITRAASLLMRKASVWLYFSHRLIYILGRIPWYLAFREEWRGMGAFIVVTAVSMATFAAAGSGRAKTGERHDFRQV